MIGKRLAHYEINGKLGRGGMGEVFLARDTKLGRDVAIKLMPEEMQADPERRARFTREAQSIAALNHPNVVTIHAVEEEDERPYLVMEYVEGRTLDLEIPAGGLPVDRFFELGLALTEAVASAHAKGITHRDLKPQNVMIDGEGRLKVLDFGLAKLLEEPAAPSDMTIAVEGHVTREGMIVGTAAYMSPEQAEGKPVDVRSDVFSLGILLYQMLTGRQPFQGDTQMSTLTAVLRDDPQPVMEIRSGLPRQMARIIRRCLEKTPDRRYETARGIHYDLEILREEMDSGEYEIQTSSNEHPAPAPPSFGGSPFPMRPALIGLAVIVIAAGSFFWFRPSGETPESAMPEAVAVAPAKNESPVVVVFPFENLGPPEDAYFAAGITDEIVTSLTGVKGVRVVSRTSALHYDRGGKTMKQIAADLGVDYVLEGSVRWQKGDGETSRVRVTPQLMDATRDEQVWAEVYDRSMDEIFKVQSDIAGEVVRSLGVTLAGGSEVEAEDIPTQDMTAYHAFLRAREILDDSNFAGESWFLAVDLLETAVERDPGFHEAWVALARAHAGLCHFDWDRSESRLAKAKAAADRAMALKPEAPLSFYAMAQYYYWGLKDYDRALEALDIVMKARPDDPQVMEYTAYVLRRQQDYDKASELLAQVAVLSPQDAPLHYHMAETLGILGQYEEAEKWGRKSMELGPGLGTNFALTAWVAVQAGKQDAVRPILGDMPPHDDPEIHLYRFRIFFELRDYSAALEEAGNLPEIFETQYLIACRDLARGMTYQAMERFDRAREEFTRAEAVLRAKLAEKPEAGNLVAAHAVALAGMGRSEEALVEIQRCFDMYPINKDIWIATWRMFDLAYVQVLAGRPADAVKTLEKLMGYPTDVISPAILRTSPTFDSLHGRDDFEKLVAAHG